MDMPTMIGYFAMLTGVIAATTVSGDFGRKITGYAFIVFTVSSVLWVWVGFLEGEPPLTIQNIVLTIINLFGVYRWLYRKAPAGR